MADPLPSPYLGLERRAFWKSGLVEAGRFPPHDLYRPKFAITRDTPILTAGSCFAQHVGRALRAAGCNVIDTEPAPERVPDEIAHRYGYRLYSARYGNIYTTRQLNQLLAEAAGDFSPAEPVWTKDGRYFDAIRPNVEPDGLASVDLVIEARARHLAAVQKAVAACDVVVFTLGLTEAWEHAASGTVYPTAPGTLAGQHSKAFTFVNYRASEVRADFEAIRDRLRALKPGIRFLLTVSPVPLTATASGAHVLSATTLSKSVLRAVAGELVQDYDDVDYFPSYEIVTAPINAGRMYEPNFRSVRSTAVAEIMSLFLVAQGLAEPPVETDARSAARAERIARRQRRLQKAAEPQASTGNAAPAAEEPEDELVCEEALLEAFDK